MRWPFIIGISILLFIHPTNAQEPRLVLPIGHTQMVFYAAYSPDGKRVVSSSFDQTTKLWDAASGYLLLDIPNTGNLSAPQFSPDGKKLLVCNMDGSAALLNSYTGAILLNIKAGGKDGILSAVFSPDGQRILIGEGDGLVRVLDSESGKLLFQAEGQQETVSGTIFSPDGKKILSIANHKTNKIWDAQTGKLITQFEVPTVFALSSLFSYDSRLVVSATYDGPIQIWDAGTGKLIVSPGKYEHQDIAAEFSPDGKKFLTIDLDSSVRIWDARTGKLIANAGGDHGKIVSATFSPNSKELVAASQDGTCRIYNADKGTLLKVLSGQKGWLSYAAFTPDGNKIISCSWDGSVAVWNEKNGKMNLLLEGHSETISSASFSMDGNKIVTSSWNNNARVWDQHSGRLLLLLKGHQSRVESARFSPDGKKIVTASWDKTVRIWDAVSGKVLFILPHTDQVELAAYSQDGKKIVTLQSDSSLFLWNAEDGKLINRFHSPDNGIAHIKFRGDTIRLLTIGKDSIARVWNGNDGKLLQSLNGSSGVMLSARFSPDISRIATTGMDGHILIWETISGVMLQDISVRPGFWIGVSEFSPDGTRLANCGFDSTAILFDVATGKRLQVFPHHPDYLVKNPVFSSDGKKLLTVSGNDLLIWNAETGERTGWLKGHENLISAASFSSDGKKVLSASWDKTLKVWNAETGSNYYSSIAVNDNDYLSYDQFNRYDGTVAARKMIYLNCEGEVIELDQVKDQLWVPNLVQRVMDGESINAQKLNEMGVCNLTPLIEPMGQSGEQYRFRIQPRAGGFSTAILYLNNIEVKRYAVQQLQKDKGSFILQVNKKELQKLFINGSENSISVKALTERTSISSRPASLVDRQASGNRVMPNLYAIVVGISDYKGEDLDLRFAAKDAIDFSGALKLSAAKLLNTDGKDHVFIYRVHTSDGRDQFPEKNGIRQLFTDIAAKALPNDIMLVFFAGHGVMEGEKDKFYFLTADASMSTITGALNKVGISMDELADWIKPSILKAQKRVLIFDACNSGQAISEIIGSKQNGLNMLVARGDEKGKQVKAIEKLNERTGMFILSASASDQRAYELGKYNQGVLTYALLKAIKEDPGILEESQFLNLGRWFSSAEKSVEELARESGARQQPQLVSTTNFNIGIVDEEVKKKIQLPFEKALFTRSDFRNTELRVDDLKLRNEVDRQLESISNKSGSAQILYNADFEGPEVYTIGGDYTIKGMDITVSILVAQGGANIRKKMEVKGETGKLDQLSSSIIAAVLSWLGKPE